MSKSVEWSQHAVDALQRLDRRTREHLFRAVAHFADTGQGDLTRASGRAEFRLRAGKWRILLTIDGDLLRIHLVELGGVAYHHAGT